MAVKQITIRRTNERFVAHVGGKLNEAHVSPWVTADHDLIRRDLNILFASEGIPLVATVEEVEE